jgi:polyisoprenoid-binding protein YceI
LATSVAEPEGKPMSTHTWTIDSAHSAATFSLKHMMVATVRGNLAGLAGTIDLDEAAPENSTVEVRIPTTTINTGMEARDAHLRSGDFLAADTYPFMRFKSTAIEPDGDAFRIHGDLTIRDVTKPVVLESTFEGIVPGMQGGRLAAFEAHAKIKRADWGLTWNKAIETGGWVVGDEIRIDLDLEAVEASKVAASA